MADAPSPHSLLSRLIAETFGTFMLVFGVVGAALFISAKTGPLGVALAVGLAVLTAAYAVGHISGGHFNPAVSIGAAAAGRMPWKDVLPYIGAQLVINQEVGTAISVEIAQSQTESGIPRIGNDPGAVESSISVAGEHVKRRNLAGPCVQQE